MTRTVMIVGLIAAPVAAAQRPWALHYPGNRGNDGNPHVDDEGDRS